MDPELSPWPPLPGDEQVKRAPPMTFAGAPSWWPVVLMCAIFNVPVVALLIAVGTARDWLIGAFLMAVYSGWFVFLRWGYRRSFVALRGWQVTVRPVFGRTKTADLRWVARARLQQHSDGPRCRLRLIPVSGYPRSLAVPLKPPEFRDAFLSRLAMVPGVTVRGRLRDELESRR
ncbi:hypothetical protein [Actinomadura sp. 3N407]|uniref:hypothetical protein n=1 Tax=Actinomadura sp. 3N407 TaxID=3457423 RepID=UPI003FCE1A3E